MEEPRRLTLEEIDERHPRADPGAPRAPARRLAARPLGRARPGRARRDGRALPRRGPVEGDDPLAAFSPNAPRHLLRTDGFPHVADIMVGSFYDPDLEEGCAFEELISFHGGLGGPQTRPFILYPVELPAARRADRRGRAGARACCAAGGSCCRAPAAGRRSRRRTMNLVWAALVVVAATALAVTAMLLVRRRAPEGSHFTDGDRASGRVRRAGHRLLGAARLGRLPRLRELRPVAGGAEQEALVLAQQVETAQFLGRAVAAELTGELVCYGRSVVHVEWPRAEGGTLGDEINPWGVGSSGRSKTVQPRTASEEAAYGKWLDQTSEREAARNDRIHGAVGVIPTPLWVVLFFIAVVIFVFMLFFADSGEGAVTQGVLMGSVTVGHRRDAAPDPLPRQPVPRRRRRRAAGRDGADARHPRRGAAGRRREVELPCDAHGQRRAVSAPRKRDWVEIVATVLLAMAAVATAWSSYQATRWNGEQAKTASRVNKTRIEATARARTWRTPRQQVDIATFIQWVDASRSGEAELVDFYRERFRAEFKPAFAAWLATRPLADRWRAADAVRHAGVPAGREGRGRAARPEAEVLAAARAAQHSARVQLRALRRPLLGRALLRRDEHEAHRRRAAQGDGRNRLRGLLRRRRLDRDVPGQRRRLAVLPTDVVNAVVWGWAAE